MSAIPAKPRGVLKPSFEVGRFDHRRSAPSPALAGLVEHYWYVSWDLLGLPAQDQETLPHPNVHLVIEQGKAAVHGVHTGRFVRRLEGKDRVFGVKFKAGGFHPFLGAPVSTLSNRALDATAVFGTDAATLAGEVLACAGLDDMTLVAERFLLRRLPARDPNVERVDALLKVIAADTAFTSVAHIEAISGMGKRALQRLFQQYVGVGPKWAINRYRMHEAIAQIQDGTAPAWAELALRLGYFDQAHFNRDFRALVGRSPTEYAHLAAGAVAK